MTPPTLAPGDSADALIFATAAARAAGRVQLQRLGRVDRISHKGARDVVTEVDHLSERLIIDAIRRTYPGDAILAEESGEHAAGSGAVPTGGTGRAWVVDPLDGTVNYANGIPIFAVSIALVVDGRPVVGVVLDPARDELFTAIEGDGARVNGRRVHAADATRLADCVLDLGYPVVDWPSDFGELRRAVRATRHVGSSAIGLSYVGAGRFDAYIQPSGMSSWDVAAAGLIAEEGGARVTTLGGEPWFDLGRPAGTIGLIACAPRHHAALLAGYRSSIQPA